MKTSSVTILTFLGITAIYFDTECLSINTMLKQTKEKFASLFGSNTKTEIIQKEIPRTTQKTLVIENNQGAIKIKTDWNQNLISLTATKKASSDHLAKIVINIDTSNADVIKLKTVFQDDTVKGSVDYTLMVPKQMAIHLKTGKGTIKVKRFDGQVWANTDNGTIEIAHVTNKVIATVTETGSITIEQSNGTIQAATNDGDIVINDAKQSVVATTAHGDITLQVSHVPATSAIRLDAAGALQVYLPQETNAHLKAYAHNGKVFSDHYITLASQTTKLNSQAWNQLQKNIEGTIGTGEAEISLSSSGGSIKILDYALA